MSTMDEDRNGLVEKIIKDLNQVLEDRELTEFDIVPLDSNTNKSPVLYVETSLGLESWCVKHVYNYCYSELIEDYLTNPKRRLSRLSSLNYKRIHNLLNPTILINPDVTTLWNKRREMVDKYFLDCLSELHFAKLVLTRRPKCNEAYAYRRWILTTQHVLREPFIEDIISEELSICNMAADKCQNNYHCWDHRAFVLDTCQHVSDSFDCTLFYFNEYKFIKQWTSNHVSDYSCFHYRQKCVQILFGINERWPVFEKMMEVNLRENFQKILAEHMPSDPTVTPNKISKKTINDDELIALVLGVCPGNCKCYATYNATLRKLELLFYELVLNDDLLKYYKCHETIWYHRRFIVNKILATMYDYLEVENQMNGFVKRVTISAETHESKSNCVKCADADLTEHHSKVEKQKENWFWVCPLYKALIKHEKELIKDRWKDSDKYAEGYENYIKFFECLFLHY